MSEQFRKKIPHFLSETYREEGVSGVVMSIGFLIYLSPFLFLLYLLNRQGEKLFEEDKKKIEEAKKRSSEIDHWSELKDNDE